MPPNANAGRTYAYSYLRLMPSLSRYANMGSILSCTNTMMLLGCARFTSQLHAFPEEVPVATDPCLQASSFCRQVRDTAQLALFHVSCTASCIMYRARRRGGGRVFVGFSLDANLPVKPPAARVSGWAAPSERRASCCSVHIRCSNTKPCLGVCYCPHTYKYLTLPASVDGTCGQSHLQRGLV
ncbi:hypothetical protein N5P37_007435 [Trichoderma harzianum]|nr:hypothetical protein N5P37_007435 [Trichoderma harzianum]